MDEKDGFNMNFLIKMSLGAFRKFPILPLAFGSYSIIVLVINSWLVSPLNSVLSSTILILLQFLFFVFLVVGTFNTLLAGQQRFVLGVGHFFHYILLFITSAIVAIFFSIAVSILIELLPLTILFIIIGKTDPTSALYPVLWTIFITIFLFIELILIWGIGVIYVVLSGAIFIEKESVLDTVKTSLFFIKDNIWSVISLSSLIQMPLFISPILYLLVIQLDYSGSIVLKLLGGFYGVFVILFALILVTSFYQQRTEKEDFNDKEFGRRFVLLILPVLLAITVILASYVSQSMSSVI